MRCLKILFAVEQSHFIPFIQSVNEFGHQVFIFSQNDEILDFCDEEFIGSVGCLTGKYDLIITFSSQENYKALAPYIICPYVSMTNQSKEGAFAYWAVYQREQPCYASEFIEPDSMHESLSDILLELSREEELIPAPISQKVKTQTFSNKFLNQLAFNLKNLINRYFSDNESHIFRTLNHLPLGILDGSYDVRPLMEDLNSNELVLITENRIQDSTLSQPDVLIALYCGQHEFTLTMSYKDDKYQYVLSHLSKLMESMLIGKNSADIDILTNIEHDYIKTVCNQPIRQASEETIIDRFHKITDCHASKTAIIYEDIIWDYQTLNKHVDTIAATLSELKLTKETPVILAQERHPWAIASMLGILKAGLCYVPIDAAYPKERITNIVRDTNAKICLSHSDDLDIFDFDFSELQLFSVDKLFESKFTDKQLLTASSLAYIIYTSGSTGTPKGVMIEHGNIVNLVDAEASVTGLNESSRILNVASFGFDAAGWDIYGALLNGATLIIAPKKIHVSPDALHSFISEKQISFATLTPAVLTLMPRKEIETLKTLIVMGDVCPKNVMNFWCEKTSLYNGYGPTEATIGATLSLYSPNKSSNCIGKPLPNYQAHVLDSKMCPMPVGFIGEIYLSGLGIARGYFGNLDLTCDKFIQWRTTKLYKTGDLGYWNSSAELVFSGRIDHQVKINGIRLELSEMEVVLNNHIDVEQSLILTEGEGIKKYLIAYVKPARITEENTEECFKSNLKKYLKQFFHPGVLPQLFVIMRQFPLNTNGKIDRKALPLLCLETSCKTGGSVVLSQSEEGASTYHEKLISSLVESLLHQTLFSIDQNIFDLGVHSLVAAQIAARINDATDAGISTSDVFKFPTVREIAAYIDSKPTMHNKQLQLEILTERKGVLTPAQKRLWFLYQLDPENTSYNLPFAVDIQGALNVEAFTKAWHSLIQKHEAFRVLFAQSNGKPYQWALDSYTPELPVIEVNEDEIDNILTQHCQTVFNLSDKPPFLALLLKTAPQKYVFFFVKHNIITDAWSEGVLIQDLSKLYNNFKKDISSEIKSQRRAQLIDAGEYLQKTPTREESLLAWEEKLLAHQLLDFPTDFQRPIQMKGKGHRYRYIFKDLPWRELKSLGQGLQSTTFMLLTSAFNIFLAKYTNQTDIIIGTALAGREQSFLEEIAGFFVNTLPLRTIFGQDDTPKNILAKTKETCLHAFAHQQVEFEQIVEQAQAERFLNKNPLFQVMLVLQNADETGLPQFGDLTLQRRLVQTNTSMFDMVWNFFEDDNILGLELDYSIELFSKSSIQRFINFFESLLLTLKENWEAPICKLNLLPSEETAILTSLTHGKACYLTEQSVIACIEKQVRLNKHNIALRNGEKILSYNDLWSAVLSLSTGIHKALSFHVKPTHKQRIAILMDRTEDLVIAILATLHSGNAYVPIDPDFPSERISYMIKDAQASLMITDKNNTSDIGYSVHALSQLYDGTIIKLPQSDELAYILYTSGSTGQPKGTMISHGNLLNLCIDMVDRIKLSSSSKFLSITTISFDIFGLELFCPLMAGSELVICSQEIARNPVLLVNYLNELNPSHMQATPTMWGMIVDHINVSKPLTILTGGEALPIKLLQLLRSRSKELWNVYGPTETTIWSTAANLTHEPNPHIGTPITNTQCYILDENQHQVPIGVWGELYIGGQGVAQGYWNNQELTDRVFVSVNGERLYKTGDRARWSHNGHILFGGRNDSQVKIRGHRLELGEVEVALMNYSPIKKALVAIQSSPQGEVLVAYLIKRDEVKADSLDVEKIRVFLENKLPSYSIPSVMIEISEIPLTPNKKVDWKRLPKHNVERALADKPYVAPQNEMESTIEQIWQAVMKMKGLSVTENFFNLGGHSLHVPEIVSRINNSFSTKLTIRDFILNSTIRMLSEFLTLKENI